MPMSVSYVPKSLVRTSASMRCELLMRFCPCCCFVGMLDVEAAGLLSALGVVQRYYIYLNKEATG